MQDQPEFHAVDGQLRRIVYEEIDQDAIEIEVQAQVDQAQNNLNDATQVREQAEQIYSVAESAAEQASNDLDEAKKTEEEAESALQKSLAGRESLTNAKQLAASQLESTDIEDDDSDGNEVDSIESTDAVNVPITLAS